jgi:hypothetical protein
VKLRQLYHDAKRGHIRCLVFVVVTEDGYENGSTSTDDLTRQQLFALDAGIESMAFRNRMIRHEMEESVGDDDDPQADPSIDEEGKQADDVGDEEGDLDDLEGPSSPPQAIAAGLEPAASRVLTPSAPPAEPRDQDES